MEPIYIISQSTAKPVSIEIAKHTVFLRKDFVEDERTEPNGEKITSWTYKETKMSHEEYKKYLDYVQAHNAINGIDDSGNIRNIIAGQENGDNNQLIIMEAIADLYDVIANMM